MVPYLLYATVPHPGSFGHGNELRRRDENRVGTADEHVHEEQHEIPVVEVAHAVVHPRAVMVHLVTVTVTVTIVSG